MTVSGICESLIASAIWAVLAFGFYRWHKRFKEENKTHKVLFETIKSVLTTELGLLRKQDLHLMILLLLNRYRNTSNQAYQKKDS